MVRHLAGGLIDQVFSFPEGRVRFRTPVAISGTHLFLWDADISAIDAPIAPIGIRGLRTIIAELCRLAIEDGIDNIIIHGYRISGANPGRDTSLTFKCRRFT